MSKLTPINWCLDGPDLKVGGRGDSIWVMVRDRASGRRNRWTLTRLTDYGQRSRVFGRELTPGHCRRIAAEHTP